MGGTDKKIRETHLYVPGDLPTKPHPVVVRRNASCTVRSIQKNQAHLPLSALDVDNAGIEKLHRGYLAGTDHASTHLLYFIIEGTAWGISQNFAQRLQAGDLFVAPVGRAAWVQLQEGSAKAVWFHFCDTKRWEFLKHEGPAVYASQDVQGIGAVMELLLREQASRRSGREVVAAHYGEILAIYIQHAIQDLSTPTQRLARQQLQRLHDQLYHKLEKTWTVKQMAAQCNVSAGHLNLIIKRNYQQTPMQLLWHIRMKHAATLLINTLLTIDQVAQQVGYSNAYAFSDAFQRHTGKRPGAYRRLS